LAYSGGAEAGGSLDALVGPVVGDGACDCAVAGAGYGVLQAGDCGVDVLDLCEALIGQLDGLEVGCYLDACLQLVEVESEVLEVGGELAGSHRAPIVSGSFSRSAWRASSMSWLVIVVQSSTG
jgi:hypothetical protein